MPAPSTLETLDDWRRFVLAERHVLEEHPELVWQLAANEPTDTAVARRAADLQAAGRWTPRPWLRWITQRERRSACLMTLAGHASAWTALALTPDGGRIVLAVGRDGVVWNLDGSPTPRMLVGHTGRIETVAVTPDARRVVSSLEAGQVGATRRAPTSRSP